MKEFKEFKELVSNSPKSTSPIWYKIADKLYHLTPLILDNKKGNTIKTQRVKVELAKLGHDLKYRVYANRLTNQQVREIGNGFKNTEWLYDIHWYTDIENEFYVPKSLNLVAECEWKKVRELKSKQRDPNEKKLSAIKFDLQKLLTSNSILKLMICRLSYMSEIVLLKEYITKVIKFNEQLKKGSNFLIICFLKKESKMYFLYI